MKSRLFCANSSDAAMHTIIRVLGKTRLEDILAKREMQYTLIVPNRFAMTAEREIFDMLDLPGAADIDVAPFSWLAINLLKSGPKRRCLTHETATLVLKRVIDSVKGDLRRYARAADSSGFAKETFDVINSVRSCGYTTDDLYLAAEKVGGLSIASKIRDIARICEGYEQALVNIDDSITRLDRLAREIKNIPSVVNTRYYVACFNKFSAKEKRILRELIQYAPSLDIATATDNGGKNRTLYPIGFAGEIESISEEAGVETDMVIVKEQMIEPFATINSELFAFSGKTCETNTENVIVYRENTIYDEANFVACEIAWLVKHKQYRYKDIAIINCNPAFVDILTSILNRYKIPFFADIKYPLSNSIAVNYLLAALDARAFEYRRDKVLRLIKSSAFGISVEESCAFENYVIKYNVTHNGFSKPFEYGDTAIAEKVRAMLFKRVPAKGIEGGKCKAVDFIKYCRRIIDIGDSGNKTPFCRSYDQAIEEIVDVRLSAVNSKALGRLNTILDDMEELLGDYTTSFLLHIETLKSTIAAVQISLIPQSLDSVFIGNIIESRFSGIKTAFITGASFGMLPSEQGTFAILSATDSDILADNGIKLYPAPADLMKEEEYLLLDIIARIKDRLYIGYATTLPDGTVQRPSTAFTEICNIAKIVPHSYAQRYSPASAESSDQLADCAVTQENAYFQYLTGMGKSFEYDEAARHNFNIL
ncbi:MAG: hypothetical protein LBE09_05660, partial [Christensenellaceae bacterium]|nr:hypothetical protein [Christensenellaceae bacterium]